ncbi:MAG: DNA polymerase ligase N-terminal domain-containing protein [Candidatus Izemoplasma sp.]|nr:DNA polymerase ligase N-terminal domain-containing protein [Candidatus Izemoplasma sp.]
MVKKSLDTYKKKRDFDQTPEPKKKANTSYDNPIFVIQKHNASNEHYDFRLEVEGVLKSWAVPKGPSTNPSDKRLAIATEDHPLKYADFEGVIPEDNYGAGEVIIWDKGTYENNTKKDGESISMKTAYDKGHISIWLEGEKLNGGYSLVDIDRGDDQWLLIKEDDKAADRRRKPTKTEPKSIVSDQTIENLKDNDND